MALIKVFEKHFHLVVGCLVQHSSAKLLEVGFGHVTTLVRAVHVKKVFRLISTLNYNFVDIFDELNGVYSLEFFNKLLVGHIIITISINMLVQSANFVIIHSHFECFSFVFEFFKRDSLARISVHDLEDCTER